MTADGRYGPASPVTHPTASATPATSARPTKETRAPMTPEQTTWFAETFGALVANVGRAVLGKEHAVRLALTAMLSDGSGISPDGERLAWIAPDEGVLNVWVNQVGADLGAAAVAIIPVGHRHHSREGRGGAGVAARRAGQRQ